MDDRISFHHSLYRLDAVEAAAAAYTDYLQVEVIPAADAVVVEISGVVAGHDQPTIMHAFKSRTGNPAPIPAANA